MDGKEIARYHLQTIRNLGANYVPGDLESLRNAGIRFLEEAVELALASNVEPSAILLHVTDALHNESKKAGVFPSKLQPYWRGVPALVVELGDNRICAEVIRELAQIDEKTVNEYINTKLELIRLRARDGVYHVVDNRVYKKDR